MYRFLNWESEVRNQKSDKSYEADPIVETEVIVEFINLFLCDFAPLRETSRSFGWALNRSTASKGIVSLGALPWRPDLTQRRKVAKGRG